MDNICIISGKQITPDHIAQAVQLDRISYDDIYQLEVETCLDFYRKNSDIYIMAVDHRQETVLGYINFSPVTKPLYSLLASGDVVDTVVTGGQIPRYRRNRSYWGYFSSIVVHPDYRQHGIATQMLFRWSDLVCGLAAEKNIRFHRIVADAISDVGVHLLTEIGFIPKTDSQHHSRIMIADFSSENIIPSKFNTRILEAYRERNHTREDG